MSLNLDRGDPITKIATVGGYGISGKCGPGLAIERTRVEIWAKGPAGLSETVFGAVENDSSDRGNFSEAHQLPASQNTKVMESQAVGGARVRAGGTTMLRSNAGAIVQVDFSALAWDSAAVCHIFGTATTGS